MFDKALLKFTKPAVDRMADYAICYKVSADQMTLIALGLGTFSALLIALGQTYLALLPLLLGRVADGVDGAIARSSGAQSDRGAFLDIALDFVFYASVPLGFALYDSVNFALPAAVLLACFVTTGTSFLAYACIAAKRGETNADYPSKGIYYLGGITEGGETILFFVLCCLWSDWFPTLATIYSVLCATTTFTRVKAGWERFGVN